MNNREKFIKSLELGKFKNGLKKHKARSVPVRLNATCTKAVLLAFVEAFIEDMIASIVEPMLLPKMIAALNSQLKELFAAIVKTIAVMAEEE